MKALRTVAFLGAWQLSVVCVAAAPSGPQMADEILRQNPQIHQLQGVPNYLKGDNVQDCPAGGAVDLSRNRCVVAYVPNTNDVFVFALHPNSRKVWLALRTDRAYKSSVFLGAFDQTGSIAQLGPGSSKASPAPGPTNEQPLFDRQWLGKWKGGGEFADTSLEISVNQITYKYVYQDEGVRTPLQVNFYWSPAKDSLRDIAADISKRCLFSASQQTRSREQVIRANEEKRPNVSADASTRKALEAMKSGRYSILLLTCGGHGIEELVLDGDRVWTLGGPERSAAHAFNRVKSR